MEPIVDLVIEDARWEAFGLADRAEAAAAATFAFVNLREASCVLLACDDARIAALNADFRGKPQPTNVLSWPSQERGSDHAGQTPELPEAGAELGDIAISYDTCARESEAAGIAMGDHVTHLVVHALLHLLGYDHVDDADAALMEGLETRILAQMGLCDPYSR